MASKPPMYRFGRDTPGDPSPDFGLWLADPQARTHAVANRADLRAWIGQAWTEEQIVPLLAAIDARSGAADHSFVAVKAERTAQADAADAGWSLGRTQTMTGSNSVTMIVFRTTRDFLL